MPGSGTWIFAADDYQARLQPAHVDLVVPERTRFKARLTWASLDNLSLIHAEENLPRVAYVALPATQDVVGLVAADKAPVLRNGAELAAGDLLLYSRGERFHQRTTGASSWTLLALTAGYVEKYSRALLGTALPPAVSGRLLRPARRDMARLRRECARVCRLAETNPRALSHPEVAHSLEQTLTHSLITCLAAREVSAPPSVGAHQAGVMASFEAVLAEQLGQPLRLRDLCARLEVTERTLREYCGQFLGLSPSRYLLLRRLQETRKALRNADPATSSIAEIAHRCGFTGLKRFTAAYLAAFGEAPSATVQRTNGLRADRAISAVFA